MTILPAYPIAAPGAPTSTALQDRLNYIVNVKDFGAKGDGVTDDQPAIRLALDRAYSLPGIANINGANVFFPPGTYHLGSQLYFGIPIFSDWNSGTTYNIGDKVSYPTPNLDFPFLKSFVSLTNGNIGNLPTSGGAWGALFGGVAAINLIGSGRDSTILRGTVNDTGDINGNYLLKSQQRRASDGSVTQEGYGHIKHLTIWNESRNANTGALWVLSSGSSNLIEHCRFIGFHGFVSQVAMFSNTTRNCEFFNSSCVNSDGSISFPRADAATPFPPVGSRGLWALDEAINLHVVGFDIGMGYSLYGQIVSNCKIERCNTGMWFGLSVLDPYPSNTILGASQIQSNRFDRCVTGIYSFVIQSSNVCSNIVTGIEGPMERAPISGMSWDSGTHVVTVTTAAPHNLAAGSQLLRLLSISPAAYVPTGFGTPDGSGDGTVTITMTSSTQFTYPGPSSNPGAFSSGNWNYPILSAIQVRQCTQATWASNYLPAVAVTSVALTEVNQDQINTVWMATAGPQGWSFASPPNQSAGYDFINCGVAGKNPPINFLTYSVGPNQAKFQVEGRELEITDGSPNGAAFGATITGSGGNHYKVRYNGTNWIRVG